MPDQKWYEQYETKQAVSPSDPWYAQYQTTATGTPIPTVAQAPGMPQTPIDRQLRNYGQVGLERQKAAGGGLLAGFPGGSMNVPSDWKGMLPGAIALGGAAAMVGEPLAAGAARAVAATPEAQAIGRMAAPVTQFAAKHPMVSGLAKGVASDLIERGARHLPFVGQYIPQMPTWAQWALPMVWGGAEEYRLGRAAEKAVVEKAVGKAVEGPEREAMMKQMERLFSGKMKSQELKATSKGLRAGKKAGEVAAKEFGKAAEQSKPLGSLLEGGTVPQTGPYILHEGETVVPAPGQQTAFQRMAQQALTPQAQPAPQAPTRPPVPFNLADPTTGRAIGQTISDYLARDPEQQMLPIAWSHEFANRLAQNIKTPTVFMGETLPNTISSVIRDAQQHPKTPLGYLKGAIGTEARVLPQVPGALGRLLSGAYTELTEPREWGNLIADVMTMHTTEGLGEELGLLSKGAKVAEGAEEAPLPKDLKAISDTVMSQNDELGEYVDGALKYVNRIRTAAKAKGQSALKQFKVGNISEALSALEPEKSKAARRIVANILGAEQPAGGQHVLGPLIARTLERAGILGGEAEARTTAARAATPAIMSTQASPRLIKILKLLASKGGQLQIDLAREWAKAQQGLTPAAATGVMPIERGPNI